MLEAFILLLITVIISATLHFHIILQAANVFITLSNVSLK